MSILWKQDAVQRTPHSNKSKGTLRMYKTTIAVDKKINILYQAFKPEEVKTNRLALNVEKTEKNFQLNIAAKDATALRAILTSSSRLLGIFESIIEND